MVGFVLLVVALALIAWLITSRLPRRKSDPYEVRRRQIREANDQVRAVFEAANERLNNLRRGGIHGRVERMHDSWQNW